MVRLILGILICIAGIALAIYVGGWLMFICGVANLLNMFVATIEGGVKFDGLTVAVNIAKVGFAGFVGWFIVVFTYSLGNFLIESD